MPIFHAIVLGIVQGLSEFLPISSSGHLVIVPWLFNWNDFDSESVKKAFDVALHLGTLIAVVGYMRKDLWVYLRDGVRYAFVKKERTSENLHGRLAWMFVLSTIPAAAVGATLDSWIDDNLGKPVVIGVSLIVFGAVLAWADRLVGGRKLEEFSSRDAWIAGAAQVLALNPGTSRSGITITALRKLGFNRESAARVSFLMSIPIIAGAVVLKMAKLASDGIPDGFVIPMVVGVIAAAIAGWVAIASLLRLVSTRNFMPYVAYRFFAGTLILVVAATHWR